MKREHRKATQVEPNSEEQSLREQVSNETQTTTLREFLLGTAARLADRYGVLPFASELYRKTETAYCLARIAAVGGEREVEIADKTARFGLSTRSEYRRATDLGGERAVIEALVTELDGTETVWDVGACVGTYTCFIADALTTGHVVGFEPETTNRSRLRMNLENNVSRERFTALPIALSDKNGTSTLASQYIEAGGGHHYLTADGTGESVETRRGESLIERDGFAEPNVIKIDVQGAELAVLEGMRSVLGTVDSVYLEIHPGKCARYETTAEEVESFLRTAGYSLSFLGEPTNRRSDVYFIHASR